MEEAIAKTGIGNARNCAKAMRDRGLSPDDALEQVGVGAAAIANPGHARKLNDPVGALHWFLRDGNWPCKLEEQQQSEPGYPEWDSMFWPEITAMSLEEQAGLLGDETARSNLRRFGPGDSQNRYALVMAYHYGRTACRPQSTSNC